MTGGDSSFRLPGRSRRPARLNERATDREGQTVFGQGERHGHGLKGTREHRPLASLSMAFNFRGFFRFTFRWLTSGGWTPRRLAVLLAFFVAFPLLEFTTWLGFLLDHIFFRGHRREPVEAPVFIVGNPRSGTTFLHRLVARDTDRFCTMKMWEILFAPSIVQRKMVEGLGVLDRWLGGAVRKRLDETEQGWREENVMHEVSLREPEEDDYLLLHIWSALTTGLSAGLLDEAVPYTYFDTALPRRERGRILSFYKGCLRRHLHARASRNRAGAIRYLAKNPALCPKLDSVFEHFPDAKIIYLVRSPLEMLPSYVNMMKFSWRVLGIPEEGDDALRDYLIDMARHWYTYPLDRLQKAPPDSHVIIKYDDLVEDPAGTVRQIYGRFGFDISPDFERVLQEESARSRDYSSRHAYSLEEHGLDRQQVLETYREIFDRFGFPETPGASA